MGVGAFIEPLVVVVLLFGGTWINRDTIQQNCLSCQSDRCWTCSWPTSVKSNPSISQWKDPSAKAPSASPSLLTCRESCWRKREIQLLSWSVEVTSPNTAPFRYRPLSRLLRKFPFLVECWYWALVYWTYQLGRAFTAVSLKEETADIARKHASELLKIEHQFGICWEREIQRFFLRHPLWMTWINWVYSFIHIPGTIAFLVCLYYYTTVQGRQHERLPGSSNSPLKRSPTGHLLYEARRRTLAVCNLLAFTIFTWWPCMPPRLLNDKNKGDLVRNPGGGFDNFVDTVHGVAGVGSIWTQNRFCNQYAAMPSLHFGYSLMIGLTIMSIPLAPQHHRSASSRAPISDQSLSRIYLPSRRRIACLLVGFAYPFLILVSIIATANHFILDAVAGAIVCGLGWQGNTALLNLLPLEDYFLWMVRIHKPERSCLIDIYEMGSQLNDQHPILC
ncbi:hypothetical protein V8E54_009082 [Elaphomyces granulatus]